MTEADQIRDKAAELYRKGDYVTAVAEYKKVLELKPGNASVYNYIGDAQTKLKAYDEAAVSYLAAVEGYRKDKLFNNAIAVCKKILRFRPDDPGITKIIDDLKAAQE